MPVRECVRVRVCVCVLALGAARLGETSEAQRMAVPVIYLRSFPPS